MPARTKTTASAKGKKSDFAAAFEGLRKVLRPYDKKLQVIKDDRLGYMSMSKSLRYLGKPVMFASITSKSYVSFDFFPVYMFPEMLKPISPELRKRMQGKTCWDFKKFEGPLFAELGGLIGEGFRRFAALGERDLTREDALAFWGAANKKR